MIGSANLQKMQLEDFRWLQEWLYAYSAIIIEDGRKFVAEKKLLPLLGKYRLPTFDDLFRKISGGLAADLHADVIEALTANETWFFRDPVHFELLKQKTLPALMKKKAEEKTLRIWCAGCSTGQEAYSLAMLLSEMKELDGWKLWLLGTDLSYRQIQKARAGHYSRDEVSRGLPAAQLVRHFTPDGIHWQAKAELRASVEFQVLRLDQNWKHLPKFDLILLRNVLYYFNETHRLELLWRVRKQLEPDGMLMLGAVEKNELHDAFQAEGDARFPFYRRSNVETLRSSQEEFAPLQASA